MPSCVLEIGVRRISFKGQRVISAFYVCGPVTRWKTICIATAMNHLPSWKVSARCGLTALSVSPCEWGTYFGVNRKRCTTWLTIAIQIFAASLLSLQLALEIPKMCRGFPARKCPRYLSVHKNQTWAFEQM